MTMRPLTVLFCLGLYLTAGAQWVLDNQWAEGGRYIGSSNRWEVPVAMSHDFTRIHLLSAAYDSSGTPESRWKAFSQASGAQVWSGSGFQGEVPIDLMTSASQDRWFLYTEAQVGADSALSNVWRIRSFQGNVPDSSWGEGGAVDLAFVGPWHDGGSMDMVGPADDFTKAELIGPWMVVAGAALDSCCAHRELPALAVLSTEDGSFHPEFGEAGRIVLDPNGWGVQDSVRHEWSGRFNQVLFVPTSGGSPFDSPTEFRILAGGSVANNGAFHPFVARFHLDGSLDTEFGNGGILEWLEDAGLNHGVQDMHHRWNGYEVGAGIELLVGVPEGEATLAAGTMSVGWMPLHGQMGYAPTEAINPGLPIQAPLRAMGLARGYGWEFEDEQVAVGTLGDVVAWDGECHPAWWTSYGSAFGTPAYWTEDQEFERHRVGAVYTIGPRLYIAGTLAEDSPNASSWVLSKWREDATVGINEDRLVPLPYPNPTYGMVHWDVPAGQIECRDGVGRLLKAWQHEGGRFSATLPLGGAWLGYNGGGWKAVQVLR